MALIWIICSHCQLLEATVAVYLEVEPVRRSKELHRGETATATTSTLQTRNIERPPGSAT